MDDDSEYNDDFLDEDYASASPSPDNRTRRNNNQDDDEDEHVTESVDLETMQRRIDSLEKSLQSEKSRNETASRKIEELEKSHSQNDEGKSGNDDSNKEISDLKRQNEKLSSRLEEALSLGPNSVPPVLRDAFVLFCKKKSIFPEFTTDEHFTTDNCARILRVDGKAATKKASIPKASSASSAASLTDASGAESVSSKSTSAVTNALHDRVRRLEKELRAAQYAVSGVKVLKEKCVAYNERIRVEKENRYRAEDENKVLEKKIEMLSSHMEKLVLHLKHEGAHKMRLAEQCRVAEREQRAIAEKCDMVSKKSAAKDRLVLELREGSKVLEDQLRLMDEKYLELRTKLDYARELGAKRIKKAERAASDLRVKFIMATGPRSSSVGLDSLPLPDISTAGSMGGGFNHNASMYSTESDGHFDNNSWNSALMTPGSAGSNNGGGKDGGDLRRNKTIAFIPSSSGGKRLPNQSHSPGGGGAGKRRGSSGASVGSHGSGSLLGLPEPSLDSVMNKIRLQQQGKGAQLEETWTEEKARDLYKEHSKQHQATNSKMKGNKHNASR